HGPETPPGAAGPPRGRVREAPDRRAVPLGRHLAPHRLRLLGPRLCGVSLDREEAPALDVGPDVPRRASPLRAAASRRPGLHERRRPRRAGGLEASSDPGPIYGRARELREPEVAPRRIRQRAAGPPLACRFHLPCGRPRPRKRVTESSLFRLDTRRCPTPSSTDSAL